jgi:hypothetical protein
VVDAAGVVALEDSHRDAVVRVEARYPLSPRRRSEKNDAEHKQKRPTDE